MTRRARGEGMLRRRSDGRWVGVLSDGWEGGKRRRRYYYGETQAEARLKMEAARRAIAGGLSPAPERLSTGAYLADWLEAARPTIRPTTYASYETIVRFHIAPAVGRIPLGRLSVADVESLLRAKSASGLSPRRVAMIRAVLRRALGRAVKHRLVSVNVAALADPPRQERHEIAPLVPDEARTFLASLDGHRFEPLFLTALTTGLRSGELRGLVWSDVDIDGRTITVRKALQRVAGRWTLVEPKSTSGRRIVPMPDRTAAMLRMHKIAQREARLLMGRDWVGSPWDLVFTTSVGSPIDASNVTHAYQAALERAGLRRQRLHDARHGVATFWLAAGVPARVVADLLGHSQVSLTLGTYSHVLPELRRDAADRIEAILNG